MYKEFIGEKVLARSYDAGLYYGTLVEAEGDVVKLANVRNIWSWEGATCLSQIANDGITSGKVSQVVSSMVLTRVCQVVLMTDFAVDVLDLIEPWKI